MRAEGGRRLNEEYKRVKEQGRREEIGSGGEGVIGRGD